MENFEQLNQKPIFRTVLLFIILICVAVILVMLGNRNDAITQAQLYKAGILNTQKINIAFENIGGKLVSRAVSEGDSVTRGTLLASLDKIDFELAVSNLEAQIENIDAQIEYTRNNIRILENNYDIVADSTYKQIDNAYASLAAARTQYREADANYERYRRLVQDNAISKSAFDNATTLFENARSALTSAQNSFDNLTLGASAEQLRRFYENKDPKVLRVASLNNEYLKVENERNNLKSQQATKKQLSVALEEARLNLSRTEIYASTDGFINDLIYEEGEMISPNAPMVVLESREMYFDVYISELDAPRYHKGQTIPVRAVALDRELEGTVRYIKEAPSTTVLRMSREQGQSDLNCFEMRIDVRDPALITGMTMEISNE